jgi:hypothetical protein
MLCWLWRLDPGRQIRSVLLFFGLPAGGLSTARRRGRTMTAPSTFDERSLARARARDAKRAEKQAACSRQREPFADWCAPGELLCLRPKACRKCSGRLLVGYILDQDGDCHGWSAKPLGACGRPDRCVARVHLPAIETGDDFAIAKIADSQVKAALDRELLIAAHILAPEEVAP